MDEKDILESDVRVTLLGDKGRYTFDWVDKTERKVEFVPKDSDFDTYTDEVRNLLNKQGIFIDQDDKIEDNDKKEQENTNSDQKTKSSDDTFEPVSNPDKNIDEDKVITGEDGSTQNNKGTQNHSEGGEEHSFIVRMSDASDRREVIDKVRDKYPDASDKLELSGPYRVTYRFTKEGIDLVSVEDIGMDKSTDT